MCPECGQRGPCKPRTIGGRIYHGRRVVYMRRPNSAHQLDGPQRASLHNPNAERFGPADPNHLPSDRDPLKQFGNFPFATNKGQHP